MSKEELGTATARLDHDSGNPTDRSRAVFDEAIRRLVRDRYDRPVMSNLVRPYYVEYLVAIALGPGWRLVSGDWSGWDLEDPRGARVEVKQSAALQTWSGRAASMAGRTTRGSFDIAVRKGYYTEGGVEHVAVTDRPADLYVFAWHPIVDPTRADHRDPLQWRFFVVPAHELPPQRTIGLAGVERRCRSVAFEALAQAVSDALACLPVLKREEGIKDSAGTSSSARLFP